MADPISYDITLSGKACLTAGPQYPLAVRKANSYWCPVGPWPGRAYVLMRREDVVAIKAANNVHTLVMGPLTVPDLYWVSARRVFPGGSADPKSAYLVELADRRIDPVKFTPQMILDAGTTQTVNYPSDYAPTAGATWQDLVSRLSQAISPGAGFDDTLPYTPTGVPDNLSFAGGRDAWDTFHRVLHHLSCTTAFNPIASTWSVVSLGAAQVYAEPAAGHDYDAEFLGAQSDCPRTVRVWPYYWDFRDPTGVNIIQDVATGADDTNSILGTQLSICNHLALVAGVDLSVEIPAKAAQLAAKIAQDLLTPRIHKVFAGIQTGMLPGSIIKAVLWRNWGEELGGSMTEIVSHPGVPGPDGREQWLYQNISASPQQVSFSLRGNGTSLSAPTIGNPAHLARGDVAAYTISGDILTFSQTGRWLAALTSQLTATSAAETRLWMELDLEADGSWTTIGESTLVYQSNALGGTSSTLSATALIDAKRGSKLRMQMAGTSAAYDLVFTRMADPPGPR